MDRGIDTDDKGSGRLVALSGGRRVPFPGGVLGQDQARRWKHRHRNAIGEPRPRVLLEAPDRLVAFSYWCLLDGSGYEVSWCPGPGGFPRHRCSLVESQYCQLVSDADVVVSSLVLNRPSCREVLDALGHVNPEKPTIVPSATPRSGQSPALVEGWCRASPTPSTAMSLLDSIGEALAKARVENDRRHRRSDSAGL